MTDKAEDMMDSRPANSQPELMQMRIDTEKKISHNVMSIQLTSDGLVINDSFQGGDQFSKKLPGVYCQGIQYFDLSDVNYINSNGMAVLIELLKCLLEINVEVQFVNVNENIKHKIRELGLEKIIHCGDPK
jgi:ABC-type transporter Mla MlaB component